MLDGTALKERPIKFSWENSKELPPTQEQDVVEEKCFQRERALEPTPVESYSSPQLLKEQGGGKSLCSRRLGRLLETGLKGGEGSSSFLGRPLH